MNSLVESELHSKIRNVEIEHNEIVIGSSLEALCYSFLNNIPFVCTRLQPPWRFDFFEADEDISLFHCINTPKTIQTNKGELSIGIQKFRLWEQLYFYLNMAGLCATADKIQSLRVEREVLKAHTSHARMAKIHFNKLIIFDDTQLYGIDFTPIPMSHTTVEVRDWFKVRSGMKHNYDRIYDESNFVKEILFYSSDRIDGEHNYKDAVSISFLTPEMLKNFDYSDINARFKTLHKMKEHGIRGARNGRDQNNPERYKFYAVKIENQQREIILPQKQFNSYDKFLFNYKSIYDIMNTDLKDYYVRRIEEQLNRS